MLVEGDSLSLGGFGIWVPYLIDSSLICDACSLSPPVGIEHPYAEFYNLGKVDLMESAVAVDSEMMLEKNLACMQIDPKRARFPCCIVWTPLPVISWLVPFIGHIGICREDGVILDFAGPNFVCVDNFAFGSVARYIQINQEKCFVPPRLGGRETEDMYNQTKGEREMTWDDVLRKSTQEFQHRSYNLFTCNCHSYVANNLNRLFYGGHGRWNVVNLAVLILIKGRWVSKAAAVRSFLPFLVVVCLGFLLAGTTFLVGLALFSVILIGWFLIGTYCFKNLIQL